MYNKYMNYETEPWQIKLLDKEFIDIRKEIASLNLDLNANHPIDGSGTFERYYILWEALKQVAHIQGDLVQCGVYKGEQAFFMAKLSDKTVRLFDSFEGATDFDESDNDFYKESPFKCSVEDCEKTLAQFDNVLINVGRVPYGFETVDKISLLYLDLDVYLPTKISLDSLWDKIVDNGILMVDTHDNVSTGVTKAITEFAAAIGREVQMLPTGIAVITK